MMYILTLVVNRNGIFDFNAFLLKVNLSFHMMPSVFVAAIVIFSMHVCH